MQTYGISFSLAFKMCSFINVAPQKNHEGISELKKRKALKALQILHNKKIDLNLKNVELKTLAHYNRINNIKAFKLRSFLPINGQRNKRNAKTARKFFKTLSKSNLHTSNVKGFSKQ